MIAGGDELEDAALEVGEGGVEEGSAGAAGAPGDALKAVDAAGGEALGEVALLLAEEAEAEVGDGVEVIEDAGVESDGDEDYGGIEGDGGEGIDGEAVEFAGGKAERADSDAGGELGAAAAEFAGVEGGIGGGRGGHS